jgi:hypothetical protein
MTFIMGGDENELLLESTSDSTDRMSIYTSGYTLPSVDVDCDLDALSFTSLGRIELTGDVGECEVNASLEEGVRATILLISNTGETVSLLSDSVILGAGENATYELNVTGWKPDAGQMTVTVRVIDSYGRILEEDSISATSRASGWNVGIFSFTAEDELKVSIQRTSYQVLQGVNCHVEIDSMTNNWATPLVRVIDIAEGDFPPVVIIPAPAELSDNEQLKATLQCDAPYDIDDDSSDDTATALYTKSSQPIVESSEIIISLLVAALLLVVAYFGGILTSTPSGKKKSVPQVKNEQIPEDTAVPITQEDEEDDFSFEIAEEATPDSETAVEEQLPVETVEVIEVPDEEDVTPSGRLASLRDEMTGESPPSAGRQDRMARFFEDQ